MELVTYSEIIEEHKESLLKAKEDKDLRLGYAFKNICQIAESKAAKLKTARGTEAALLHMKACGIACENMVNKATKCAHSSAVIIEELADNMNAIESDTRYDDVEKLCDSVVQEDFGDVEDECDLIVELTVMDCVAELTEISYRAREFAAEQDRQIESINEQIAKYTELESEPSEEE